jgi:lysophospholipase L1-like esterase
MQTLRLVLYGVVLACITICSAEVAARIEDRIRDGTPISSSPSSDSDLKISDGLGPRGKPFGHYKKWKLNEWGFRGPSIQQVPGPGTRRVLVMGASESFGLYEGPDLEFPAQLASQLAERDHFEVVNAAVAGMTLATMTPYWESWVSRFKPSLVVVYASPLFYLAEGTPKVRRGPFAIPPAHQPRPASRYLDRLRDLITIPTAVQDWRDKRAVSASIDSRPPDWEFRNPPTERLDAYISHLRQLGEAISRTGSHVVIATHATRTAPPLSRDELVEWERGRVHIPKAPPEVAARFHQLANERIRQLSLEAGWPLVDADAALSGRSELFGDLVHFSDQGAHEMARLIASTILTQFSTSDGRSDGETSSRPSATEMPSTHALQ